MPSDKTSLKRRICALLKSAFVDHPESVGETYFQHQRVAAGFAGNLIIAAAAAIVHSIFPCWCKKTASNKIARLNDQLHSRAHSEV